jgi:hypothetical protein
MVACTDPTFHQLMKEVFPAGTSGLSEAFKTLSDTSVRLSNRPDFCYVGRT